MGTQFKRNERIQRLWKRSTDLSKSGKRNVYVDNAEFLYIIGRDTVPDFRPQRERWRLRKIKESIWGIITVVLITEKRFRM